MTLESGLVVMVPEADPILRAHKQRLGLTDAVDDGGVPAHITILCPFIAPPIDRATVAVLERMCREVVPFSFVLESLAWFERDILYLRPHPDEPFRGLIGRAQEEFPHYPPYDGIHGEPTPHLTVLEDQSISVMEEMAASLQATLPIPAVAREATLLARSEDGGPLESIRLPFG